MLRFPRTLGVLAVGSSMLLAAACGNDATGGGADPGQVNVVTAFYPLQFVTERVAGSHATITSLTAPGTEPHDLELTPKQVGTLSEADVVIYEKSFQAAVDTAVEQSGVENIVDVSEVVPLKPISEGHDHEHGSAEHGSDEHSETEHGELDPHVWLDPANMITIAEAVTAELTKTDPDHAADYQANLETLRGELSQLDQDFSVGLADCQRKEFIVSHAAFGYLADKYGLTQIGISGLSPESEPSPTRIADIHAEAEEHQVTTIFYETLVSPDVATTIADDLGLKTGVLDPLEGLTEQSAGDDYVAVMRSNLEALRTANDCA